LISVSSRNAHPAPAARTQKELVMQNYQAIQKHIEKARIERSVYLGEVIADTIVGAWNGIKHAACVVLSVARAKTRNNVFTFDA
jgi:hypothetical protein